MRIMNDVVGKEVVDSNGMLMGVVGDLQFDVESKELLALILKQKGFSFSFSSSNNERVVPYDSIKKMGDVILLKDEYDI